MRKYIFLIAIVLLISCCKQAKEIQLTTEQVSSDKTTAFYSQKVKDSFFISVSLPKDYDAKKKYPTVYLLDANLYFDLLSVTYKKYSEIGLIPPVILVGIGYKDLQEMDSLRTRDYTFPVAIPEYEMSVSGKADAFLSFMNTELVPDIDSKYSTDTNNRILMGHSLGGYFTLYALQQHLKDNNSLFHGYIAASPSTHYNGNYILNAFEKLNVNNQHETKVFVAFGGLEDDEDPTMLKTDAILSALKKTLKEKNMLDYKAETYSNLDHMDAPFPAFMKGLTWVLAQEN